MPDATFPISANTGCSTPYTAPENGYKCKTAFSCQPYAYNSNSCVDCEHTTCSYTLGGTIVTVGVTIGVGIVTAAPT